MKKGKFLDNFSNGLVVFFVIAILLQCSFLSPLISRSSFINYYLYSTLICLFSIASAFLVRRESQSKLGFNIAELSLILFSFYTVLLGIYEDKLNLQSYYWPVHSLLLLSLTRVLPTKQSARMVLVWVFLALAALHSIACLLQFFKIFRSFNSNFPITGLSSNPNITAMTLAMLSPVIAYCCIQAKSSYWRYCLFSLSIILGSSLILLNCRTAMIGALLTILIVIEYKSLFLTNIIRGRGRKITTILFTLISILALSQFIVRTYTSKKGSSQSRLVIWEISTALFKVNPVLGVGYGYFEREYNLKRAHLIQSGVINRAQIGHASYARMAYNEYLQNFIEGGILGGILFLIIIASFVVQGLKLIFRDRDDGHGIFRIHFIAALGVIVFAIMSIVNFTVQAIPVMCLFAIYCSFLSEKISFKRYSISSSVRKYLLGIGMPLVAIFIVSHHSLLLDSVVQTSVVANRNNFKRTSAIFEKHKTQLSANSQFWISWGNLLFERKLYSDALVKYKQASNFSAEPNIYLQIARCETLLNKKIQAERDYRLACFIDPDKLSYKYHLMIFYEQNQLPEKASLVAQSILASHGKGNTKKIAFYKRKASSAILKFKLSQI